MVKTFAAIPLPTRISIGASGKRGLRARQFLVRVYTGAQSPPGLVLSPVGSCSFLLHYTHSGSFDSKADEVGPVDGAPSTPACCSTPVITSLPYLLSRAVRTADVLNIWSQLSKRHRDHTSHKRCEVSSSKAKTASGFTRGSDQE